MRAAALFALLMLVACQASAQPVAKLEVVKASREALTEHQKLDRIESKVDQLLKLHEAPAKPPVVEPPPVEPKPPVEPPPAADNPFIAWCAAGNNIQQYIFLRNGGIGLSPAQLEQARAAGCFAPPPPPKPAGPGGAGAVTTGPGWDLGTGDGQVKINPVQANHPYTFTFTVRPGTSRVLLRAFGAPGDFFTSATDSVNGRDQQTAQVAQIRSRVVEGLPPGRHTYTVAVNESGSLGVQVQQW